MQNFATFLGLTFGLISCFIAVRNHIKSINKEWRDRWETEKQRQAQGEVKAYAAERDFNHLRTNQEQIKESIKLLQDDTEDHNKLLIELKTLQAQQAKQVDRLAEKLDESITSQRSTH